MSVEQDPLYSSLKDLVEFRFHVKQKKLNHQQDVIIPETGSHLAIKKGRGMTFSEVRQYQPGDDIRHIDWKVTARIQKPHTKMFVEENERPTVVVMEQTPNLFFGSKTRLKTAQVLNIGAVLSWVSLTHNERVGGICFNHRQHVWVAPKRDQHTVLNLLQQSVEQQSQVQTPKAPDTQAWPDALTQLIKVNKPGNKIFLIGDMMQLAKYAKPQLGKLKKNADITAIHIYDDLEKQLPSLGWLNMTTSFESNQIVKLDSFREKTRETYEQIYEDHWKQTKDSFIQLHIPIIQIGTHEEPLMSLIENRLLQ
jgi:uncharacterized protein (DUF58 family)